VGESTHSPIVEDATFALVGVKSADNVWMMKNWKRLFVLVFCVQIAGCFFQNVVFATRHTVSNMRISSAVFQTVPGFYVTFVTRNSKLMGN
jgi:hypothetical protein